jgi:hypothetical protein
MYEVMQKNCESMRAHETENWAYFDHAHDDDAAQRSNEDRHDDVRSTAPNTHHDILVEVMSYVCEYDSCGN